MSKTFKWSQGEQHHLNCYQDITFIWSPDISLPVGSQTKTVNISSPKENNLTSPENSEYVQ